MRNIMSKKLLFVVMCVVMQILLLQECVYCEEGFYLKPKIPIGSHKVNSKTVTEVETVKKGDKSHIKTTIDMNLRVEYSDVDEEKVKAVVFIDSGSIEVDRNGHVEDRSSELSLGECANVLIRKNDYKILEENYKNETFKSISVLINSLQDELPKELVTVGSEWEKGGTKKIPDGMVNYTNKYKVVGVENINSEPCIKIEVLQSGKIAVVKVTDEGKGTSTGEFGGTVTLFFSPEKGKTVKLVGTTNTKQQIVAQDKGHEAETFDMKILVKHSYSELQEGKNE